MGAAHRMLGFRKLRQQPFHLVLFERHIDFDGGMARNRGRYARAHCIEINGLVFTSQLLENLIHHVFDLGRVDSCRSDFYRHAARAKRLRLKPISRQFLCYFAEDRLLRWRQFNDERHEQALALDLLRRALPQHSLKKHALVSNVLIDDPQAVFIDRKNK